MRDPRPRRCAHVGRTQLSQTRTAAFAPPTGTRWGARSPDRPIAGRVADRTRRSGAAVGCRGGVRDACETVIPPPPLPRSGCVTAQDGPRFAGGPRAGRAPVRAPGSARIAAFAQLRAARCAAAGSDEAVQACEAEDQVQTYEAEDQVCRAVIRQCKPIKRRIRSAGRPDLQGGHPPCPLHHPPRASAERRPPDLSAGRWGALTSAPRPAPPG